MNQHKPLRRLIATKCYVVWDFKGIVNFELLPENTTSAVHCDQLEKLGDALKHKRPEFINRKMVVFHQDNARPRYKFEDSPQAFAALMG